MKNLLILLLMTFAALPSAIATRSPGYPPPSDQEFVASARWIFAGRVARVVAFPPDLMGAPPAVYVTIIPGLILRGDPPKTLRVCMRPDQPIYEGRVYIFFAEPTTGPDGINAHAGFRPYTTALLNRFKALIPLHPYQAHVDPLIPPQFRPSLP